MQRHAAEIPSRKIAISWLWINVEYSRKGVEDILPKVYALREKWKETC